MRSELLTVPFRTRMSRGLLTPECRTAFPVVLRSAPFTKEYVQNKTDPDCSTY